MPKDDWKYLNQDPRAKARVRRVTANPGYGSYLPRCFPYSVRTTFETASGVIESALVAGHTGFALTEHSATLDGHVTLWLSAKVAEWAVDTMGLLRKDQITIEQV